MNKKLFEIKNYFAKQLTVEKDTADLQRLCEDCSDYYIMMSDKPPASTEGKDLFHDMPPNVDAKNKLLIGIYNQSNRMVGFIDMIKDFPEKETWFIGQMMIIPNLRNQGLGRETLNAYQSWAKDNGVKTIGLSVIEKNENAFRFWSTMGFKIVDEKYTSIGDKKMKICVMKKELPISENFK